MTTPTPIEALRLRRLCSACKEGDHVNCGMQTWCECECDPEAILSDPFPDIDSGIVLGEETYEIKIPWGAWDSDGFWYPNPLLKMPAEEQKRRNEQQGYQCREKKS